jgi:hypothetical protein
MVITGETFAQLLKIIDLRENYASQHAEEGAKLLKTYLEASQRFQRNPEDHTDEFRETLESILSTLSRRCLSR